MDKFIAPKKSFNKTLCVPGDKSITHRAVMFNAAAEGEAVVSGGLLGEDCLSTIGCMRALGAEIKIADKIKIRGTAGRFKDNTVLDCGNSGTTMRLLAGLLSGAGVSATLTGDASLSRRPMKRVVEPLRKMGADISDTDGHAPLFIRPAKLRGIEFENTTGSAQVKSAVLLAGLNAEGQTAVCEKTVSRNHTEIMLAAMGAKIDNRIKMSAPYGRVKTVFSGRMHACDITVPGDISSAAFLWAAGAILKGSAVTVKNVGVNETRTGILEVLKSMGAIVKIENERAVCGEKVADVTVGGGALRGTETGGAVIPSLIDEIPVIAVVACFAEGRTVIKDAAELRVKETDRIKAITDNLAALGADITATEDGMIINGRGALRGGATVDSFGDHRIAMAMAVAGLASEKGVTIKNADCTDISFPHFWEEIE